MGEIREVVDSLKGTKTGQAADELLSLIPRAINVALERPRRWIVNKEINFKATTKLLQPKLQHIDPQDIHEPEAHIGVPALMALSYSMDSEALQKMYANLLARAMTKGYEHTVHPGFVDIIKQLSPFDALLLQKLKSNSVNPMLRIKIVSDENGGFTTKLKYFISESLDYDYHDVEVSVSNLNRLGLINAELDQFYTTESNYDDLINSTLLKNWKNEIEQSRGLDQEYPKVEYDKKMLEVTPYGKTFTQVCLSEQPLTPTH